ncbi:GntR family transcriptional regulator (plasmid) [Rhodobacteraceae bacterium SC52]|nr:GntR family transcriptional regulator [Rhodobacteraceae bacterium SC52]
MNVPKRLDRLALDGAVAPQLHGLLRDRIVSGELSPGQRVSETELAKAYKVSRQPVREAFIKLAEEELVDVRPQRGTFVRAISVQAVLTARFVREAVEADLVRRVAHHANPAIVAKLDDQLELQREATNADTATEFTILDKAFHRLLAEFAGQPEVSAHLQAQSIHIDRVRNISARTFSLEKLLVQHRAIVDAIRAGDVAAAEQAMRLHLREINNDLPRIVEASPHYFEGIEALL